MDVHPEVINPRKYSQAEKALAENLQCPILHDWMLDPVIAADGYTYERAAITDWIEKRGAGALSPMTGLPLPNLELIPNVTLKMVIGCYKEVLLGSLTQENQQLRLEIERLHQEKTNAQLMAIYRDREVDARRGLVKPVEIIELLYFTSKGQLDKVRNSLKLNRNLVHAQGNIDNLRKITGFQRAILSGREALWKVYLEFLPEADAHEQLMALINERPDVSQKYGAVISNIEKNTKLSSVMKYKRG